MRSPAQACEQMLALLLTDAQFRARFKADAQGVGRELGLDEATLQTLRKTDWVGLELAARSHAHKSKTRASRKRHWWPFR
jgi:hypothetical protein